MARPAARSSDHILGFFTMLRRELAFYVGCLNLHSRLSGKGEPLCFPTPLPLPDPVLIGRDLYDPCLSLRRGERVVGNDVDANGAGLVVITGANEGGKSTFLRSVGLAQLMTQAGMFVAATAFTAVVRLRLFTHYRREEDTGMESGKLDEELARQVIHALLDSGIKVLIVTHLYDLAQEPLPTGFGEDLYQQVFGFNPRA